MSTITRSKLMEVLGRLRAQGSITTQPGKWPHEVCLELEQQGLVDRLAAHTVFAGGTWCDVWIEWEPVPHNGTLIIHPEPLPVGATEFGIRGLLEHPDGSITVQWEERS